MPLDEQEAKEEEKSVVYDLWLVGQTHEDLRKKIISLDPTGKNDDEYQDNY